MRVERRHVQSRRLTLGDLRQVVADAEKWGLRDDALVSVDARQEWVSGVDQDGEPSKPYPEGNGGHYRTGVVVRGESTLDKIPINEV